MAEDTKASSNDFEMKQSGKVYSDEKEFLTSADIDLLGRERNKEDEEEEEAALDGEFIKVEKEFIDVNKSLHLPKPIVEVAETSGTGNLGSADPVSNINLLMEGKIKELELQLKTVIGELKHAESEKSLLKSEVDITNEKLEKMIEHCEELKLNQKATNDQILEAQAQHNLHLETLQESLTAKDMKNKELLDMKEAFTGLSDELEMSREKMKELETELVPSASKAHLPAELNKQNSSQAELESKRALEFEKMLELARVNEKEMEGRLGKLQNELEILYDKTAENQYIEESLQTTSFELSTVQQNFETSKTQVEELEQKVVSQNAIVHELMEELNLHKASEEKIKAEVHELENLLSASNEDLKAKIVYLEDVEQKLQERVRERELIEASFRNQEIQTLSLENHLSKLIREKETLESTMAELSAKLSMNEELCIQLEAKLHLADQNFIKKDLLLSEVLPYKEELEQKLKSLEQLHHESRTALEAANHRTLELEGSIQALNAADESIRAQLKESETRLVLAEKRNMDLEEQLNIKDVKCVDAGREKKELEVKIAELSTLLRDVDEESSLLKCRFQGYEDRIGQLEYSLSKSLSRNSELEKELNNMVEKCAKHEGRATATHQRTLELEDLIHASHSKAEDAGKRVEELEQLLEASKVQTQHLEQLLSSVEARNRDADAESKQYSSKISELSLEHESCQARTASLNVLLEAANERERELTEFLNVSHTERKEFEGLSFIQGQNLSESDNLIQVLQSEVKSLRAKVECVEEDLKASSVQEKELLEKLRYAEEQLKQHEKAVDEVNTRNQELKALHESLVMDSELKLKKVEENFKQKVSEARELQEKLKSLEEHMAYFKIQAIQATEKVASLKAEMEVNAAKLVFLENNVEELKQKASDAYLKAEQTLSEKEMLSGINSKLREELEIHQLKVNELTASLSSMNAEKEVTSGQLASHVETIAKLTDEHSRVLELQSVTESRFKETEVKLHEVIEKLKERDSENTSLNKKLLALDAQLRTYKEQVSESAEVAASQKGKLEEALSQLWDLERLVEQMQSESDQCRNENEALARQNLSLTNDLATYVTKINEIQIALNTAIAEKEDTSLQLHSSREEMENLKQKLNSDKQRLQSQITSAAEENNMLNEMYHKMRKEHESIKVGLEEQLSEQKAREVSLNADVESLKAELADKSLMQAQILELKQKQLLAEKTYTEEYLSVGSMRSAASEREAVITAKLKEHLSILQERENLDQQLKQIQNELDLARRTVIEQRKLNHKKQLGRESSMKQSLGELEEKHQYATLLEKQVEDLKQKLQEAETQYKEKVTEESKKLALLNEELSELRHKLSQTVGREKKISELENKMKLTYTTSREEVEDGTTEAEIKDKVEVKSRDPGLDTSTLSRRKGKKKSEISRQSPETIFLNQNAHAAVEPTAATAFKFVLGVAIVSLIIGIILGKRY